MFVSRVLRLPAPAMACLVALAPSLAAQELLPFQLPFSDITKAFAGHMESSTGVDVSGSSQGTYSSVVIAPFSLLSQDGWRIKLYGSYGMWSYDRQDTVSYCMRTREEREELTGVDFGHICNRAAGTAITEEEAASVKPYGLRAKGDQLYKVQTHQVQRTEIAVLPGYQISRPGAALNTYLGPAFEARSITPSDSQKELSGPTWGAKTGLEGWLALGEAFWLGADGGYFTGTQAYSASVRLGYQPLSWLALGPEAAAFGDMDDDSARAGGFLRLTIGATEATIAGGMSSDYLGTTSAYGSAGLYTKF